MTLHTLLKLEFFYHVKIPMNLFRVIILSQKSCFSLKKRKKNRGHGIKFLLEVSEFSEVKAVDTM